MQETSKEKEQGDHAAPRKTSDGGDRRIPAVDVTARKGFMNVSRTEKRWPCEPKAKTQRCGSHPPKDAEQVLETSHTKCSGFWVGPRADDL